MLLQAFVKNKEILTKNNLQCKTLLIDAHAKLQDFNSARTVLETINDEDCILKQYAFLARGTNSLRRVGERLKQKSCEIIFLSALKAKAWERACRLMNLLESISPGYFTSTVSYTKLWPWQRCLYAGVALEHSGRHNDSTLYLAQAFAFLYEYQDTLVNAESQRLLWATSDATRLVNSIARGHLKWKLNQPNVNRIFSTSDEQLDARVFEAYSLEIDYGKREHYDEALYFLEMGRSKYMWRSNTDQGRYSQLGDLHKLQLWEALKNKSPLTQKEAFELRELDATIDQLGSQVRSRETHRARYRHDSALLPFKIEELYQVIPKDAIVIYTGLSEDGLILLAVDFTGIKVALLNDSAEPKLLRFFILLYIRGIVNVDSKIDDLRRMSSLLSPFLITKEIETCIAARDHVIFVPSGDLVRLPFGALLFKDKFLALQKQVSQLPSLTALREIISRGPMRPSNTNVSITVIARPGNPRDQWLPMAGIEAISIAALFGSTVLDASITTNADFQCSLQESLFLHLCTHGERNLDYPLNSYITLKEKFRVIDVLAVRTKAVLVTFSACLSGEGQPSDSGDVQGFSHAILAAGAGAFIGALWKVNDITTTLHMSFFYRYLLVLEKPSFAEAWHYATRHLYHLIVEEACGMLERHLDLCDKVEARGKSPKSFTSRGKKKLQTIIEDWKKGKNLLDFKHPRYWAPFVLVDDGSSKLYFSQREEILRQAKNLKEDLRDV